MLYSFIIYVNYVQIITGRDTCFSLHFFTSQYTVASTLKEE
jgi:hypothetical protein